jgi:hypothetical protein
MPTITGNHVAEGTILTIPVAGTPTNGTSEIHTLTIGGTPTGGTFKLAFLGSITAAITWSSTDATLIANIQAALRALPTIGTAGVTVAAGTGTSGIGTYTITFGGNLAKLLLIGVITVDTNSMTGTSPTVAVAQTTPGVTATRRGAPKGSIVTSDDGKLYAQTATTPLAPTWTVVGTQS